MLIDAKILKKLADEFATDVGYEPGTPAHCSVSGKYFLEAMGHIEAYEAAKSCIAPQDFEPISEVGNGESMACEKTGDDAVQPQQPGEAAFQAFMLAVHEHGTSGLGYRKALAAYAAAKVPEQPVVPVSGEPQISAKKLAHSIARRMMHLSPMEIAKQALEDQGVKYGD